ELPDGKGSISFDGVERWVRLQVSRTPALPLTAGAISFSVVGLCLSLFIRPRRLWVRVRDDGDEPVRLEVAGLDRAEARPGLDDEVAALTAAATGADPQDVPGDGGAGDGAAGDGAAGDEAGDDDGGKDTDGEGSDGAEYRDEQRDARDDE